MVMRPASPVPGSYPVAAVDPWRPGSTFARRGCFRRELFGDGNISISAIECGPGREDELHAQTWDQPTIVLVRMGRFGRCVRGRSSVVDSTQACVGHAGDEEWVQHLGSAGHRCTVLTLGPGELPPLFRVRARLALTEFRTSPATDLAHRLLLAACRRGGEPAAIRQMAAALVADLLGGWWAASSATAHRVGTRAATRRVVDIAREIVTTNSTAPRLQSVATAVNISPQYLTRIFKQDTGMTLGRYRNRVRVRLALEMLAAEDSDLKWIAHDLGFFDRSHFSKVVMAEVGLPPHEVRRLLSAPGSWKLDTAVGADTRLSITRSA